MRFGPGVIVTAALIGPGMVTAATLAGIRHGFALLWMLVPAAVLVIVLQDMAARLGVATRRGLGEALMASFPLAPVRWLAGSLVLLALALGNTVLAGRALAGGGQGLAAILGDDSPRTWTVAVLVWLAAIVILSARYSLIERVLVGLAGGLGAAFLAAAVLAGPDLSAVAGGLVPRLPEGGVAAGLSMVGALFLPSALFLHAAAARERWPDPRRAGETRADTALAIGFGAIVTILILAIAASVSPGAGTVAASGTLAAAQPGAGAFAGSASLPLVELLRAPGAASGALLSTLIGLGILAAGLTTAIALPVATAFVVTELAPVDQPARRLVVFRATGLAVLLGGAGLALSGPAPAAISALLPGLAGVATGLLLPLVAAFLLLVMNTPRIMGAHVNGHAANVAGALAVLATIGLGIRLVVQGLALLA